MQLVIVSNGLRVISRGTTDGNALGLFGADETVRSLCRDELMAEVGGGMEEDAGRGGDPSIGRRRHGPKSRGSSKVCTQIASSARARCPRSSTAVGGVEVGPSAAAALRVGWSGL